MSVSVLERNPQLLTVETDLSLNTMVAAGGGGGLNAALQGMARTLTGEQTLTGVVTVADDGGGTGRLRRLVDKLLAKSGSEPQGILAVGDIRNAMGCLALPELGESFSKERLREHTTVEEANARIASLYGSMVMTGTVDPADKELRSSIMATSELLGWMYDLDDERLSGQPIGNALLVRSILPTELGGDGMGMGEATKLWSDRLGVDPRVRLMPATEDPPTMHLKMNGRTYSSEVEIDKLQITDPLGAELFLTHSDTGGSVVPYGPAVEAVENADAIIIVPSSLYSSFALKGFKEAIAKSRKSGGVLAVGMNMQRGLDTGCLESPEQYVQVVESLAESPVDVAMINTANGEDSGFSEDVVPLFPEHASRLAALALETGGRVVSSDLSDAGVPVVPTELAVSGLVKKEVDLTDEIAVQGRRSGVQTDGSALVDAVQFFIDSKNSDKAILAQST